MVLWFIAGTLRLGVGGLGFWRAPAYIRVRGFVLTWCFPSRVSVAIQALPLVTLEFWSILKKIG